MRKKNFLNIMQICLGVILAAWAVFASPAYGQDEPPGDIERGGRLYTAWDLVTNQTDIAGDHPLWPRVTSNQVPARVTWRCVNCHGWDYRGSEGLTLGGPQRAEGYPSLLSYISDPVEEVMPWLNGSANPAHDFSDYLSEQDLQDLGAFLTSGLITPDLITAPESKEVQGTLNVGSNMYQNYCQSCHGVDGEKINFGSAANPFFMGDLSWSNPWRIAHTVRYGHLGATVPPASRLELSFSQQIDLLAYAQSMPRARTIAAPDSQLIDYNTQASTTPMVVGAVLISLLIFATAAITTMRRKQS